MVEYYYDTSKSGSFGAKTKKLPKERWIHSRPYTLHKPVRKIFPTKPTLTSAPNIQYQADLMDLQNFKKENQGHAYVLIVTDVFSHHLFAYPLKNKLDITIFKAFTKLFRAKHIPIYIQTDQGTEFFNNHMKKRLQKYKVTLFSVKSQFKASMAERVIRTIKAECGVILPTKVITSGFLLYKNWFPLIMILFIPLLKQPPMKLLNLNIGKESGIYKNKK